MKGFFRFYFLRVILTALLLGLQLAGLIWCACCAYRFYKAFRIILWILSLATVLKISECSSCTPNKTGWIIGILALPMVFLPMYCFYGGGRVMGRIQRHFEKIRTPENLSESFSDKLPRSVKNQFLAAAKSGGFGLYDGENCKYLPDGEAFFEQIKTIISKAERYIFMEFFILDKGFMWGEIYDLLKFKVSRGVKVCILIDDMGTICLLPSDYPQRLREQGIECLRHNAFSPKITAGVNYRDHRKIVVADGRYAMTGGANIADEYINRISPYGYWKDTGVYTEGRAAQGFAEMFRQMWELNGGTLPCEISATTDTRDKPSESLCMPLGDIPSCDMGVSERAFINMINAAVKTVFITTPYLVPDKLLISALTSAAERGLDVRIITPLVPDKRYVHIMTRRSYKPLLEKGVKIYEYQPGFIHAKSILCDGNMAYVGSANLDYRSLYLHFECGLMMYNTPACKQLGEDFTELFGVSERVTSQDKTVKAAQRSLLGKLLSLIMPLL